MTDGDATLRRRRGLAAHAARVEVTFDRDVESLTAARVPDARPFASAGDHAAGWRGELLRGRRRRVDAARGIAAAARPRTATASPRARRRAARCSPWRRRAATLDLPAGLDGASTTCSSGTISASPTCACSGRRDAGRTVERDDCRSPRHAGYRAEGATRRAVGRDPRSALLPGGGHVPLRGARRQRDRWRHPREQPRVPACSSLQRPVCEARPERETVGQSLQRVAENARRLRSRSTSWRQAPRHSRDSHRSSSARRGCAGALERQQELSRQVRAGRRSGTAAARGRRERARVYRAEPAAELRG